MIDDTLTTRLNALKQEIAVCKDENELRELHARALGRKGIITDVMAGIRNVAPEQRKEYGQFANRLKMDLTDLLKQQEDSIFKQSIAAAGSADDVDLLIPVETQVEGTIHPITAIEQEIIEIFKGIGFRVTDGPEMETDYYNFEALNTPADHPARDMQDTYWLSNDRLLRSHTSTCQIRAIEKYGVPLRVIAPGRCFRNEDIDASHENTFHQVEGLMIDKDLSVANLVYILKLMFSQVFKRDVQVRLRPGYFPFVEPGFELDLRCVMCDGRACKTCGYTGWVELVPCGLVHWNVLKMANVDPEKYSGFAFGLGLSRLVMMRYNIGDIRVLNRGDLRELSQFHMYRT